MFGKIDESNSISKKYLFILLTHKQKRLNCKNIFILEKYLKFFDTSLRPISYYLDKNKLYKNNGFYSFL